MSGVYDAAVVGAGIGGLTAAARLVREGLRVLVLEQAPHPGGTAYTFIRRGFQFPMGPLGFSSPGVVRAAWEELTGEGLRLKRVDYLLRAFGMEVPLSLPIPRLEEKLAAFFPGEAAGIRGFFSAVRGEAARGFQGASSAQAAAPLLGSLVEDGRLRRILGSQGTREPYSSLGLLASIWELMCEEGIHYPEGGFRRFCDTLAAAVTSGRSGGEVRLRTAAAGLVVSGGRVTGVVLEDGEVVPAGAVISNADFKSTFLGLLEPAQVPGEWREAVRAARQSSSNLQVALGVDASRLDLSAFSGASRIIYRREGCGEAVGTEPGAAGPGGPRSPRGPGGPRKDAGGPAEDAEGDASPPNPRAFAAQELEVCLWSVEDPGLAPAGGAVVVIRTGARYEDFTQFRLPGGGRSTGYAALKERLAEALIREASALLPGLGGAVRAADVATPLTFADQGRRSGGAVAGWSWEHADARGTGEGAGRELIRTPLGGLYMAGHQAFTSLSVGGVPAAMRSGLLAAEAVLESTPPTAAPNLPHP